MPIVLKQIDSLKNVYYLTRSDKGTISLSGGSGIALSLSYVFGEKMTPVQIELEEQVTPQDLLAIAKKHSRHGQWTIEPSAYNPSNTSVPAISTVEYSDGLNRSYVRRHENGRVNLVSERGVPLALSNIVPRDAVGVQNRLALCTSAADMYAILREAVYQPNGLTILPERAPAPATMSPELEQALQIVAALLNDEDGSAAEAAEELLAKYGISPQAPEARRHTTPRPR